MSDQKLIIGYYRLSMEDDSEGESNKNYGRMERR